MDDSSQVDNTGVGGETALVARAAAELGVSVPPGFSLLGVDDEGKHVAINYGDSREIGHGGAILARLDGKPITECLADMNAPAESGLDPEWAPPTDWTDLAARPSRASTPKSRALPRSRAG